MESTRELAHIDLVKEFRHQAKIFHESEPVTGAFWEAMSEAAQAGPIAENIEEVARIKAIKNPDVTAPYIAGIVRTAYRAYLEESDPNFDIQSLTTKESWRQPLGQIALALNEEKAGRGDLYTRNLHTNLWTRQVQTTIPERYAFAELLLQVTRERFPNGVNALDIGTGIMLGPLAMMDNEARKRLRFKQAINPGQLLWASDRRRSSLEYVNTLLAKPSILNSYVCVDTAPIYHESRQAYDQGIIAWSKASRRPSEANDPLIDRLTSNKPDNVRFYQANLAKAEDFVEFKKRLDAKTFDVITRITTDHQMNPGERAAMDFNLRSILSPNGLSLIVDFASLQRRRSLLQPQDITDLRMLMQWHRPLSFRGFINDQVAPKGRKRGLEHAASFNDSRCKELTLGLAHIAINGERVPLSEAIRLAAR